jgi:hypothetical protein
MKEEIEQLNLFDVEKSWRKEWEGMPEYEMGNTEPFQKITISFKNREDVKKFSELIQQRITSKTDTLWFPKDEDYIAPKNFKYVDES